MDRYCETTGKRRFTSRHAARQFTRRLRARLRIYLCEFCRRWHLTSAYKHR